MKISDLESGMNNVELTANVTEVTDIRDVQTKFGPNTVATAILEDETGSVKLTLWGKQIEKVKAGVSVQIKGGYVKEWRGEKQLGVGRRGELNVVSGEIEELEEEIEEKPEEIQ